MEHFADTHIGQVRRRNEDAYLIDRDLGLFAVADGMGGHQAGDVASRMALDELKAALEGAAVEQGALAAAIRTANRRVFEESVARGHVQGMGTTLSALWLPDGRTGWVGHVGDSRCYRYREGALTQLTRDHSWVQTQIDDGLITKEQASSHPLRNVITRSIGFERQIEGDLIAVDAAPGDLYLLASDGLTGKLGDERLAAILAEHGALANAVGAMIEEANAAGGEDNITVVVVRPGGDDG